MLQLIHPQKLNDFNATFKNRDDNSNNSIKSTVKQLKLEEVGKTVKKLTQTDFNDANLKLIINTVSPFTLIEHPAFIEYCKLTSQKVPVSRRSLMRDVEKLFEGLIKEMKTEFNNIAHVCLTADCWSVFHRYVSFINYNNIFIQLVVFLFFVI